MTTEQSSMVDELAADADNPQPPPDAPPMTPYLKLPYRVRGDFMKKMAVIRELAPSPKQTRGRKTEDTTVDPALAADYFYLLAEIEELLQMVCEPAALAKWQGNHTDSDLVDLYNVYMRWSQAGEASSSAS